MWALQQSSQDRRRLKIELNSSASLCNPCDKLRWMCPYAKPTSVAAIYESHRPALPSGTTWPERGVWFKCHEARWVRLRHWDFCWIKLSTPFSTNCLPKVLEHSSRLLEVSTSFFRHAWLLSPPQRLQRIVSPSQPQGRSWHRLFRYVSTWPQMGSAWKHVSLGHWNHPWNCKSRDTGAHSSSHFSSFNAFPSGPRPRYGIYGKRSIAMSNAWQISQM